MKTQYYLYLGNIGLAPESTWFVIEVTPLEGFTKPVGVVVGRGPKAVFNLGYRSHDWCIDKEFAWAPFHEIDGPTIDTLRKRKNWAWNPLR